MLDPGVVKYNMQHHEVERFGGGEAEVYLLNWHLPPDGAASSSSFVACPINPGRRVALKVRRLPDGSGGYLEVANEADWQFDGAHAAQLRVQHAAQLRVQHAGGVRCSSTQRAGAPSVDATRACCLGSCRARVAEHAPTMFPLLQRPTTASSCATRSTC